MNKLIQNFTKALSCPFAVLLGVSIVSFFSLAAALIAEVVFELEPCPLCIYQRIPFVAALLLSLIGLVVLKVKKDKGKRLAPWMIGLNSLLFLANSAIATYHTGVERHWWRSAVEGCAVPNFSKEPQSMLENILSAPTGRCDEIPWADPIFGLSMANYNILLCLGLFILCAASALLILRQHPSHS